jgi:bacteriocin biosynthesis cyclodehydratase domain-containing protein
MKEPMATERLVAVPVQVIGADDGVILARGCVEVKVAGARAAEVVQVVLRATQGEGTTRQALGEAFAAPDRPGVLELVDELVKRRLLVPAGTAPPTAAEGETALEVFYWHFGERAERVVENLNAGRITILGVNAISRQLATSLAASGMANVEVVDFHILRNLRLFGDSDGVDPGEWPESSPPPLTYDQWSNGLEIADLGCVVATSDFGGRHLMREWNEFCVANRKHFLPVVLDRMIGFVGPHVIPGESACYECLRARESAAMDNPDDQRASELGAFARQPLNSFHPTMAAVVAEIAALELTKFYSQVMPWKVGRLIEINLLAVEMKARKVLKLPRCPVCSPVNWRSSTSLDKASFAPQDLEHRKAR